MTDIPEKI